MEQKLLRFIHEHELTMYNKKVIIAVSGGPDSVDILHDFKKWRKQYNLQLYAITINHQLRKEAKEDVKHVANLCNKWDIPLVTKHINVRHYKREHNVSTQVAARNLRYKAFNEVMQEKN